MFERKDEYLEAKQIERENFENDNSNRSKLKGALFVGMVVATMALTGCGNEVDVTQTQDVVQEQDYETYYFFNGISENPIEIDVVDKYVDFQTGKYGAEQYYESKDGYVYCFNEAGCQIGFDLNNNGFIGDNEVIGTFQGAAMIRVDYYNDNEIAQDVLGFGENENQLENNEDFEIGQ